jgi:hypothetical protein
MVDVTRILNERAGERLVEKQADWEDEASQAALAGNPRRAGYLEYMSGQLPRLVQEAYARARGTA